MRPGYRQDWGGNFLSFNVFQFGRIKTEKVYTEHTADLEEQRGVDAVAMEDVVDIPAVTVDLAAQPGDCAFLAAKFSLDVRADGQMCAHGGGRDVFLNHLQQCQCSDSSRRGGDESEVQR